MESINFYLYQIAIIVAPKDLHYEDVVHMVVHIPSMGLPC